MFKMSKYRCSKCGATQIKQPTNYLIDRVQCYKCGDTQLLTNVLGPK